jgi:peptide/nickel transport system substrate-binding protein
MICTGRRASRRAFLSWTLGVSGLSLLAACTPSPTAPSGAANTAATPAASPTSRVSGAQLATAATIATPTVAAATAPIKRNGVLKAQRQNEWPTHDPHLTQTNSQDMPLVFDYLTRIDRNPATGTFDIRPSLAESWDLPNPTTVVFKLRPAVKFHDGTDCDASAVKWNLDRMMTHPQSAAKNHTASIASVEAPDATTLRLNLKTPSPVLFVNLSSEADSVAGIISPTHAQRVGDTGLAREAVGTGPYQMVEFRQGSQAVYRRNPTYWKKAADGSTLPYLDEVRIMLQQDTSAALLQLRAGDLDLITPIAGRDVASVKSNSALSYVETSAQGQLYCLVINARPGARLAGDAMKPVRQAIMYGLDRETVAKTIGLGLGEANYYHVVPGQVGYADSVPRFAYDPARAKQLLSDAGYPDGIDIQCDFTSRPEDTQNAQVYQQMLAKIGVRLTLQPSERVAWVNKTLAGNFEFATYLSGVRPDPDLVLGYRVGTNGSGNYASWTNADVEAALEEGRSTYDQAKRQAAYEKVQQRIYDDAYYGFVWRRPGTFAMTSALKGFQAPIQGYFTNSMELWLDR